MIPYPYHAVAASVKDLASGLARRARIEQYVFDLGPGRGPSQAEYDLLTAAGLLDETAAELRLAYERIQQTRRDAQKEAAE